jgi:hypothetical protein
VEEEAKGFDTWAVGVFDFCPNFEAEKAPKDVGFLTSLVSSGFVGDVFGELLGFADIVLVAYL